MKQQEAKQHDAAAKRNERRRKTEGGEGEKREGDEGEGKKKRGERRGKKNREGREGEAARGKGKDDSLISTTLPLGGCSTSRPELETNEPVLQVSVWNGNGRGVVMWNGGGSGA